MAELIGVDYFFFLRYTLIEHRGADFKPNARATRA